MAVRKRDEDSLEKPGIIVEQQPDDVILAQYVQAIDNLETKLGYPIYKMDRNYVTLRRDAQGLAYINMLDRDGVVTIMAQAAYARKYNNKAKQVDCPVPVRIAAMLLQTDTSYWPLKAVSRVPVLSTEGQFNMQPGYDSCTQIYYDPASTFALPKIPHEPTQADARKAAETINDLLCDFPFKSEADRANALALGLTFFARHAIDGCVPMAVIDAISRKGTGKGLLVDTLHIIATGQPAPVKAMPDDKNELRKAFLTDLMKGNTVVAFDNVRGTISNDQLEAMITARIWNDRILGVNKDFRGEVAVTWCMTGNGVQLAGDMPRRAYYIRLDAGVAHAYARRKWTYAERDNADKLIAYVKRHQGKYLAAFMTMIRAWFAADRPAWTGSSPIDGSFGVWCHMIGGILEYAGVTGYLANVEDDIMRTDIEDQQWENFLLAIAEKFPDSFTAGDIISAFASNGSPDIDKVPEELALALGPINDPGTRAHKLSRFLRPRLESRFGSGVRLMHAANGRSKAVRYRVDVPVVQTFPCPKCHAPVPETGITLSGKIKVAACPSCGLAFNPDFRGSME